MRGIWDEDDMVEAIQELIEDADYADTDASYSELCEAAIRTFNEAGLLTQNKGLVIRFRSNQEYQIQVIRAK